MNFKKRDILLFILIPVACISIFFANIKINSGGDTVLIYLENKLYKKLPLDEDSITDVNGTNTVIVSNKEVYINQASCPDKLCIHQGKIKDSSKDIVCLPNKVVVKVNKKSEIDAVSW